MLEQNTHRAFMVVGALIVLGLLAGFLFGPVYTLEGEMLGADGVRVGVESERGLFERTMGITLPTDDETGEVIDKIGYYDLIRFNLEARRRGRTVHY